MQRIKYVGRFCVLLFLIIDVANVNALSLASCDNPLENEVCNLTCTTTNHSLNVAFNKVPDPSIIAQCDNDLGCSGTSPFSISQPDSVTTVLSFIHSRNYSGTWICAYGLTPTSVPVPWATYPQTVSTTLTSNTTVDTNIDGNVTLWCFYSEQSPTVTLQYEDANGNNDAISAETFQCDVTDIPCADVNFTTYGCPVVVKEETGIDHSDTYSIKLKIKVSHVQTEDVHTIVTGITFKGPTTTAEQQTTTHATTTHETTTDETTTHETTTDETTTEETTTMETNDGSKDIVIAIIIGTVLGACVLIGIIIIIIIVLVKKRGNKRDYVKTTKQDNSNKTWEPSVNKSDTPDHMAMQHGKPRDHAVNKPGNPGLVYVQNDHHVDYDDDNPEHLSMPNEYHVDYDRRNYSGNPEHESLPKEPPADYDRNNDHDSHL